MTEKVLNKNKNGMRALLLLLLGIVGGFGLGIYCAAGTAWNGFLVIPSILCFLSPLSVLSVWAE